MKIPHHGSRTSAPDDFLAAVSPSIAVISVGRDNSFGHPSQEVLEKLEGKRIFRTDQDGAVKIVENGEDLLVKTCREFMFQKADNFATEKENIRKLFTCGDCPPCIAQCIFALQFQMNEAIEDTQKILSVEDFAASFAK